MDDKLWFEHTDDDGDRIVLRLVNGGIRVDSDREVNLGPQEVNHLHAVLGAWLADNGITAKATTGIRESFTDADVRRIVREEIAVRPLHRSPLAEVNPDPQGPEYCTCSKYTEQVHFAHDPEPADVGHPGAPESADAYGRCTGCAHYMALHLNAGLGGSVSGCTAHGCKCTRIWSAPEYTAPALVGVQPSTRKCGGCGEVHS